MSGKSPALAMLRSCCCCIVSCMSSGSLTNQILRALVGCVMQVSLSKAYSWTVSLFLIGDLKPELRMLSTSPISICIAAADSTIYASPGLGEYQNFTQNDLTPCTAFVHQLCQGLSVPPIIAAVESNLASVGRDSRTIWLARPSLAKALLTTHRYILLVRTPYHLHLMLLLLAIRSDHFLTGL